MMTAEQLKGSILQMAMQGKLVEQRPEEGTGEELYKEIQTEKKRLIKEGVLKTDKTASIGDEDFPMDIPGSWKWVRFGDLFDIGSAIRIHQTDWKKEGIPFFRGRELVRLAKTGEPDAEIFITQELYEKNKAKGGVPQKDDLLVSAVGTIGRVYIVKGTKPFYYKDAYILRFNNYGHLYPKYFKYVIESPFEQAFIKEGSMGTTVAQLTILKAKRMLCPLPPLAEQKRIVAKIEELMPFVEQYAATSTKLNTLNASFPEMMKKSILQEAVQGKLVPQDPNDEPASLLLKKIAEEKKRLIKEGKIKKQKPLPEITEDEIPFDIPESWEWVRFTDIAETCLGKMLDKEKNKGVSYPYLRNVNVRWGDFDLSDLLEMKFDNDGERFLIRKGDMVVCEGGEPGRCAVWNSNDTIRIQKALHRIRYIGHMVEPLFYYYVLQLYAKNGYLPHFFTGTTIKHLPGDKLNMIVIPCPPLNEQKRIVQVIERCLPSLKMF